MSVLPKAYLVLSVSILILSACGGGSSTPSNPADNTTDTSSSSSSSSSSNSSNSSSGSALSACNDGIDNDGDGYVDWQYDLGCVNANDDEISGTLAEENGFTTFDVGNDSKVIYVSSSQGNDINDGLSPATAVQSLSRGAELLRDGENDFLLLRRGDTWRGETLGRFISGKDADHPVVIASYGSQTNRPRLEIDQNFIDHNGRVRNNVAIIGLELISYPKIPSDSAYDGESGGGFRYVGEAATC